MASMLSVKPTKKLLKELIERKFDDLYPPVITCQPGLTTKRLAPSSGYTNAVCTLCRESFQQQDDVVIGEVIAFGPGHFPKRLLHRTCYDKELKLAERRVHRRLKVKKAQSFVITKSGHRIRIRYVDIDDDDMGCGSVQFHHDDCGGTNAPPIAYIEGYEWLHGHPDEVTVFLGRRNSEIRSERGVCPDLAYEEVKKVAEYLLQDKARLKHGRIANKIEACQVALPSQTGRFRSQVTPRAQA